MNIDKKNISILLKYGIQLLETENINSDIIKVKSFIFNTFVFSRVSLLGNTFISKDNNVFIIANNINDQNDIEKLKKELCIKLTKERCL